LERVEQRSLPIVVEPLQPVRRPLEDGGDPLLRVDALVRERERPDPSVTGIARRSA
jgi:hypothetical protein